MMFEETSRAFGGPVEFWEGSTDESGIAEADAQIMDTGPQKILLPRGSAETRFAPCQYYYPASKSGVVPSWTITVAAPASSQGPS